MGNVMPIPPEPRRSAKSETAFRTISEVSEELDVPQHVLRFWETKFGQIRPMKRGGGRRYYRPEDVVLLRRIRSLLYTDGFTIKGVQKLLREGALKNGSGDSNNGTVQVVVAAPTPAPAPVAKPVAVVAAAPAQATPAAVQAAPLVAASAPVPLATPATTRRSPDLFAALEQKAAVEGLTPAQRATLRDVVSELSSVRDLLRSAVA